MKNLKLQFTFFYKTKNKQKLKTNIHAELGSMIKQQQNEVFTLKLYCSKTLWARVSYLVLVAVEKLPAPLWRNRLEQIRIDLLTLRERMQVTDKSLSAYNLGGLKGDYFIVVYEKEIERLYQKLSDNCYLVNLFVCSENFFKDLSNYEFLKGRKII